MEVAAWKAAGNLAWCLKSAMKRVAVVSAVSPKVIDRPRRYKHSVQGFYAAKRSAKGAARYLYLCLRVREQPLCPGFPRLEDSRICHSGRALQLEQQLPDY